MGTMTLAAYHALRDKTRDLCCTAIDKGETSVGLGDMARNLSRQAAELDSLVTPMLVSGFLRSFGMRKIGQTGTGYDRQPLYGFAGWKGR
jgi:hypothetical protein